VIPIKTEHFRLLLYVVLPLIVVAGALLCTIRVSASGQEVRPEARITEQSVAEERERGAKAIKYATDFQWVASPTDYLSSPGAKTAHLARCAPGVLGSEPEYWVYIAGAGRPEAVKVTGGSCKGDDQPGTLQFTTSVAHGAGYTLSSASSGLQEASIAARWGNTVPNRYMQGGKVAAPPGEFRIYAPVSFLTTAQTIDFSGSMFECWVADDACLKVGLSTNYNGTLSVTLLNPRGRPTQLHGQQTMIAVYGQGTRIEHLMTMMGVAFPGEKYGTFGSYIKVIGDQAFLLDGLDTSPGYGLECTAAFCGTVIVAPGPFGRPANAAVGWLKNLNLNLQCMGNGIDWQSGNTLRVSDSVIQGYNQFGVRGGTARGGYGMIEMDNIYMEDAASCQNPLGNVGTAGVVAQGGLYDIRGGEGPSGHFPKFANTGKMQYDYYIVAHHAVHGASNPLYAGSALTGGTGEITVTTPDVPGAASFDLLRLPKPTGDGVFTQVGPAGTGDFAIATGVSRASACARGVCTFTDKQAAPAKYTVPEIGYIPFVPYWPGSIALFGNGDSASAFGGATARLALNGTGLGYQANVLGMTRVAIDSTTCTSALGSPIWISCLAGAMPPSADYIQNATVLSSKFNRDGGKHPNLKGRLNLLQTGTGPGHIITLSDSDPGKTIAARNNRPTNDPDDSYIGQDTETGVKDFGLSLGAPASISEYVGNAGDGKNWKERLTSKEKTFAVPVVVKDGSTLKVGNGTAISQMKIFHTAAIPPSGVPGQSCVDVKGTADGLTAGDQISGITPPKPLGKLALNAYASGTNTVTLHFCNASASAESVPVGAYTFLGVH
jgi:hypothetical protein